MALCANNCGSEAKGRSKYCSPSCKVAYNRNKGKSIETNRNIDENAEKFDDLADDLHGRTNPDTQVGQTRSGTRPVTHEEHLEFYYAQSDKYAVRDRPDKLNWGPWMDTVELDSSPFIANRVPIPGDWDYAGQFN